MNCLASVERYSPPIEQLATGFGQANYFPPFDPLGAKQAAIVGIFPDRQARAGGAPGFEHFFISALPRGDKFKKVQDQSFHAPYDTRSAVSCFWARAKRRADRTRRCRTSDMSPTNCVTTEGILSPQNSCSDLSMPSSVR